MLVTPLVGIDFQALACLATGPSTLDLQRQDLIYSIGLIDYFSMW